MIAFIIFAYESVEKYVHFALKFQHIPFVDSVPLGQHICHLKHIIILPSSCVYQRN